MNFTDREKELLLGNAPVLSRITLYGENGEVLQVFNENDYLVDWDYEDFRYVPDQGFIGQFVERLLDGHLMNIPEGISLEDKEISVEIAVVDSTLQNQVYHNYGRFIITKVEQEDTTGSYKFESSDYAKKFNVAFKGEEVTYPCTALELLNHACNQAGVKLNSGKNLFDKNKPNDIACSMASNGISNSSQAKTIYVPIESGKTYTISKIQSARFRVGTTQDIPAANVAVSDYVSRDNATSITITASTGAKYLVAYVYISTADTKIYQDILDNIQIEESYTATTYESYPELTYSYCISEDGLEVGNYYFKDGDSYYNFTISENLRLRDSLMLVGDKIVQRKVTDDYKIVETDIYYTVGNSGTGTELECSKVPYIDFTNNNFVIEDNQFEEQDSCRTVVTSIAKLSYTWARINEDNVLKLDFVKKVEGDTDSYNEIDTDKYYEATVTGNTFGPVNKVVVGMSDVDGENIVSGRDADELSLNDIYGETSQVTTTGKNIAEPYVYNGPQVYKGITCNYDKETQTYTFNGTCDSDNATFGLVNNDIEFTQGVTTSTTVWYGGSVTNYCMMRHYTSDWGTSCNYSILNLSASTPKISQTSASTFTSPYNRTSIRFNEGSVANNFKIRLMVAQSTDTSYEPYTNGQSPNPTFAQEMSSVSGNNIINVVSNNMYNYKESNINHGINGVTVTLDEDNYITLNGTTTNNYPTAINSIDITDMIEDGETYTIYQEDITPSTTSNTFSKVEVRIMALRYDSYINYMRPGKKHTMAFTVNKSTYSKYYINVCLPLSGESYNNYKNRFMLLKGNLNDNKYHEYEKSNINSYKIDLPSENLFDGNYVNAYIGGPNQNAYTTSSSTRTAVIKVSPNTKYSITKFIGTGIGTRFSVWEDSELKQPTNAGVVLQNRLWTDGNTCTVTTSDTANYLYIYVTNDTSSIPLLQVERGIKSGSYTSYGTIPIDIGENLWSFNASDIYSRYHTTDTILAPNRLRVTSSDDYAYNNTTFALNLPDGQYTFKLGKSTNSNPNMSVKRMSLCYFVNNVRTVIQHIDEGHDYVYNLVNEDGRQYGLQFWANYESKIVNTAEFEDVIIQKGSQYINYTRELKLNKINNYKDSIFKNTGKNIFNLFTTPTMANATYSHTNNQLILTVSTANQNAYAYYDIPCKTKTTYNISYTAVADNYAGIMIRGYKNNTQYTTLIDITQTTDANIHFTTENDTQFLRLFLNASRNNTGGSVGNKTTYTNIQLEEGNIKTDYEPFGNGDWYLNSKIGTDVLDGSEWWVLRNDISQQYGYYTFRDGNYISALGQLINNSPGYSNYFEVVTAGNQQKNNIRFLSAGGYGINVCIDGNIANTADLLKAWLYKHNVDVNYILNTPLYNKITYQPLIDQLNAIQDQNLFNGANHITIEPNDETPTIKIDVKDIDDNIVTYEGKSIDLTAKAYANNPINIYDNPLTHSEALRRIAINGSEKLFGIRYTPMEVNSIGHPWLNGNEFMKVTNLEDQDLYFYPFDRKMSYKGYLETNLSAQSKNEVSQKYENKNTLLDRMHHTEIDVDKANGQISLISTQTDENTSDISNLIVTTTGISTSVETIQNTTIPTITGDINTINNNITNMNSEINDINNNQLTSIVSRLSQVEQTAEAITNMFQITGGINTIRNSAFLLEDAVWEFTNSGTNPYHTTLGDSYNVALSGNTVSVAEIKLRSVKVKSKSENITNLKIGTKYTFNFYHKQDSNMTTTIKMYSTENNNSKAFNDITISGQQSFKNYEVSFTPTTYSNYTLEIIVSSTASVGYSYIYDLMLNAGDKQSWQPASDEIYSTTLTMSRLGLQVYSVGDGTITVLGSDGLASYETTDGRTRGRLVSQRTVDGDITRSNTTQSVYLTSDILNESASKWIETIIILNGRPSKVEYLESGQ